VTCKDVASFILEYLENELDGTTRAMFEQHLSVCPNCVRYLAQYQATIALGRQAFQSYGTPPPLVPEDLIRAVLVAGRRL
jgi:anti-sigma factor RsiW